jgi:carbamoyl-phosphate synthase large subunit
VPSALKDAAAYVTAIEAMAADADLVLFALDGEIEAMVELGRYPKVRHILPSLEDAAVVLSKSRTVAAAGRDDLFPSTHSIMAAEDLDGILEKLGGKAWIRPTRGTSGAASLYVEDATEARAWIQMWKRRGASEEWMAQTYLPGVNINWTGLWLEGECVAWAAMEREVYYLGNVAPSGVTGQVKRCKSTHAPAAMAVARETVLAINPAPRGVYSVDLREDADGVPRVNEINPRIAGRPYLYLRSGVNFPAAALAAFAGEPPDASAAGGRAGVILLRQLDVPPTVIEPS